MVFFEISDVVNIISIIINLISVFFVAVLFQNIQVNSRTLKDYYIKEIDEILKKILQFLKSLEENDEHPQGIHNEFINYISLLNNISKILSNQYNIDLNPLISAFAVIQQNVEDDNNFTTNYSSNMPVNLEQNTITAIKNYRFDRLEKDIYDTILKINNYKINVFKALKWW